ncbi:MAG: hypothetical protein NT116_06150 [Candidatus Parcubacteria bacterium]|nr:hypothetical protein [Candidatus Parcubacteria bacterium]
MAPENYTVELNEAAWDLIITALEVYCASYLDEFLKDSEYLEICAACGFQGNEAKIIPAIIYEIESQTLETLLDALVFITEENTGENPGIALN